MNFPRSVSSRWVTAALVFLALALLNNVRIFSVFHHASFFSMIDRASMWQRDVLSVGIAAVGIISLTGVGAFSLSILGFSLATVWSRLMSFAVGLALTGTGLFFLGLTQHFTSRAALVGGILFVGFGVLGTVHLTRQRLRPERVMSVSFVDGIQDGLWIYAFWVIGVFALAPSTEWDVLAYHLAIPKLYLLHGGIYEIPWLLHSHWPHLLELCYVVPLALHRPEIASLWHASVTAAAVIAVYATAEKYFGRSVARWAVTFMLAEPIVLRYAGCPHADAGLTFFSFLSTVCVWRWREESQWRWVMIGGFFMGAAAACKLHGLVLMASVSVMMFLFNAGRPDRWKASLLFLLCGTVVVAPWLLKTWIWDGNPIWPFGASWFGGAWGGPLIVRSYESSLYWTGLPPSAWWTPYQGVNSLFSITCFVGFFIWRGQALPGFLRFLVAVSLPYVLLLVHHLEFWRFIWPVIPTIALFGAWVFNEMRRWRWIQVGVLAIVLWPLLTASPGYRLFPVLGLRSSSDLSATPSEVYLHKMLDGYSAFQKTNGLLGPTDRVLLFREIRGYYLNVPYQWGDPLNQGLLYYPSIPNPDALYRQLKAMGLTHVLVNVSDYTYDPRTTALMQTMLTRHATVALVDGSVTLYQLL